MNLKNINDLINIRSYIAMSTNNGWIDKKTINYLNNLLLLLDKKILAILMDDEFKSLINYQNLPEVLREVKQVTNIKYGLKI